MFFHGTLYMENANIFLDRNVIQYTVDHPSPTPPQKNFSTVIILYGNNDILCLGEHLWPSAELLGQ